MLVKVNPTVTFWGFKSQEDPSIDLWLTDGDPKPHRINVQELPSDVRNAIEGALRTNYLLQVDENGKPAASPDLSAFELARPVEVAPTEKQDNNETGHAEANTAPKKMQDKFAELDKLINSNVSTIKREILAVNKRSDLVYLHNKERNGKNRKTVKDLIAKQMSKFAKENGSDLPVVESGTELVSSAPSQPYETDIEEGDFDQITVKLGD